jgi:hypothetical protein
MIGRNRPLGDRARLIEAATGLNASLWETVGHFLKGLLVERGEFAQRPTGIARCV